MRELKQETLRKQGFPSLKEGQDAGRGYGNGKGRHLLAWPCLLWGQGPATESLLVSATKWDPDGAYIAEFLSVTDSINAISFEFQCIGTRSFELPL